jgi:DNA/RNA-binding domain of Phe-tRNA-synthetase-like protein
MGFDYQIAPAIFAMHPHYCRGLVVIDGADNTRTSAKLSAALRDAEASVRATVRGNAAEHPRIAAWREAYRQFGAKPSEHRSSIESLVRRVLKGESVPSINPLVDIGNLVSLRHLVPAGVHPLKDTCQELALRAALPGDTFIPSEGQSAEVPEATEVVFASGHEVLTRRWTWRQAAGTQTLPDTTRVFFNIDGLPPATRADVDAAIAEVAALVAEHCGGRIVHRTVLDAHARFTRGN